MDCSNLPGDFNEEFLNVRGKDINNPELARGLNNQDQQDKHNRMIYGATNPLPWEKPMLASESIALTEALAKKFECPHCKIETSAEYQSILHTHTFKFNNSGNSEIDKFREKFDRARFGKYEKRFNHIGVFCRGCKRFIQYVPFNLTNRRAAKDPVVNGPHQFKRKG